MNTSSRFCGEIGGLTLAKRSFTFLHSSLRMVFGLHVSISICFGLGFFDIILLSRSEIFRDYPPRL
jgi:hypothetical protein